MYIFKPEGRKNFQKVIWFESAIGEKDCDKILAMFDHTKKQDAGLHATGTLNKELRNSELTWLYYDEEKKWLFHLLHQYLRAANRAHFGFDMSGFYEPLQLTRYPPGGFYSWHEDNMEEAYSTRKLSLVVQITDPKDYEGGDLVVFPNYRPPRARGTVTVFPSFVTHKVEPVKEGVRYSLVAWATGEPFR
jgi:PKHD-type hydroxylase